jgi:hypothetical protein
MASSITRNPWFSQSLVRVTEGDQSQAKLNGFRGSAVGTSGCALTIACPKNPSGKTPLLMLTDIYAVAATPGALLTVTSSAGSMTPVVFTITAASLVENLSTPFPCEVGEDLILTITGGGSFCNVVALGWVAGAN